MEFTFLTKSNFGVDTNLSALPSLPCLLSIAHARIFCQRLCFPPNYEITRSETLQVRLTHAYTSPVAWASLTTPSSRSHNHPHRLYPRVLRILFGMLKQAAKFHPTGTDISSFCLINQDSYDLSNQIIMCLLD